MSTSQLKKVNRDGKIAILYSPGFGAGWYTWNKGDTQQCIFSPEIVELVENNQIDTITEEYCQQLFNVTYFYTGGADQLKIKWLPEGTHFEIEEYDGAESIVTFDNIKLIA